MSFETVCSSSDRAAWLELRRLGIGSSDAPSILGLSPWGSPLSVYADKLGLSEDREQSEAMKWGTILEPIIAREYGTETGRRVRLAGDLLRCSARPWQLATLDAEQECDDRDGVGVLEIKATGHRAGDWREGVPDHVFVQVQHQLAVTGMAWASVAVLQNGARLLWADVPRDDAFIDGVLVPAEAEFWRRVEAREPVAPDGSEASRNALKLLYPADNGVVILLPGEMLELDQELVALKAERKARDSRIGELETQVKAAIGPALAGVLPGGITYTYRAQKRESYVVKEAEFRVLRRTAPKGGR